jgi:hypothetical protein
MFTASKNSQNKIQEILTGNAYPQEFSQFYFNSGCHVYETARQFCELTGRSA